MTLFFGTAFLFGAVFADMALKRYDMKRILIFLAVMPLYMMIASAQQIPDQLEGFYSKIKSSCLSASYEYTVKAADTKVIGQGTADVQKDAYRMSLNGLDVYSDGKTLWMKDGLSQEVMIDAVDPDAVSLVDNPILFVAGLDSLFDISMADGHFYTSSTEYTVQSNKVVMLPKQTEEILFIDVHYNLDFSSILAAVIYMKDGAVIEITIPSMSFGALKPHSHFVFDTTSLSEDYVVTDLR